MIIKMRNKNYKLDTKECEYEISVTPENVLVMKKGINKNYKFYESERMG